MRTAPRILTLLIALAGCVELDGGAGRNALVELDPGDGTCAGIDICRPCDPDDFELRPDGTNRCGFVLSHQPVAVMGTAPIAYQGADSETTWQVTGANPDGSPIVATSTLTGEPAFEAIHAIAEWDDHYRGYDTDPPIGEWVTERGLEERFTSVPTADVITAAAGTSPGNPALPVVRCGDQSMTVSVTWPHLPEGPITNCDCERILRETARRYAEYHHLDLATVSVTSFAYAPSQYLRDDYAGASLFANPAKRRIIRATDGPNAPAISNSGDIYTIVLHAAHPHDVKSDAKIFKPAKAVLGFRAYDHNRKSMVRSHNYFKAQAAKADAPRDAKMRIIHKVDHDVIVGSGPLAGVLATHLPDAMVLDDGEKRHLHRNNTRIIQKKEDVAWARYLGADKPDDFVEPRDMVEDGPLRHVHVGLAAEQLFTKRTVVPGKITKIETVDGEVHLEMKVDGVDDTFVVHVPKTKRVWIVTGPPETAPANYTVDDTAPAGATAQKLLDHGLDTKVKIKAFIDAKIHTNNEWYDLPHETIASRVNGKRVFVFGTGGGAIQAVGQITDGAGGAGEVASAKKVIVASFDGGIKAASGDLAVGPGGGQEAAWKALKKLAGVADGDADLRPTSADMIYGFKEAGDRQPPVVIDRVSVVFHDPGDGSGERPMLRIAIKRPKANGDPGLADLVVHADEAIWSLVGPGKTDLGLDATVVKTLKLAMEGEVPLGATAVEGRVRFVAANSTQGILATVRDIKDTTPDAGTAAELGATYQRKLLALRGKPVSGVIVGTTDADRNSLNEGTLMNQIRYIPLFAKWSPP